MFRYFQEKKIKNLLLQRENEMNQEILIRTRTVDTLESPAQVRTIKDRANNETQVTDIKHELQKVRQTMLTPELTVTNNKEKRIYDTCFITFHCEIQREKF